MKVTVPVGPEPPLSEAVSEIGSPIVPDAAFVLSDGVALVTVEASPLSLQPLVTGLFASSPLYAAFQRYVPALNGENGSDDASLPDTVFVDVNAGVPMQLASSGAYALNVIVPVGLEPPESVALSDIDPPSCTDAVAVVPIVGLDFGAALSTVDSPVELQRLWAWTVPRMSLYTATHW
jgi:hypothetical protein